MTRFQRLRWLLGLWAAWSTMWLLQGLRSLWLLGENPHPFLPTMKYTGVMLRAVGEWALGALIAYLILGTIFGFLGFLCLRAGSHETADEGTLLTFRKGAWMGLGSGLWIHGCLFAMVPGTLANLPLLRWAPMALVLLLFLGLGAWALFAAMHQPGGTRPWARVGAALGGMTLVLMLPHDLFRRHMSEAPALPATAPRMLILGVDGLRRDVADEVAPAFRTPEGIQPVVAVPATRIAWNMLLGGDPETLTHSFVIPFRREWRTPHALPLLEEAKAKGLRASFLIDDATTLAFGLTTAPFAEVREPFGGWKHFFSAGAGFTWPVYSWIENYLSPVETTNPWSEPRYYFRDVARSLSRNQWVSAHTCQLHAPFFLRARELQAFRPWIWLGQSARSYSSYQSTEQAQTDGLSRQGLRADPAEHYRIRSAQLLLELEPHLAQWSRDFPALSGALTSDHGETHFALMGAEGRAVTHLTGVHGFFLDAPSVRVPLIPLGRTENHLPTGAVYSWFHLRDGIRTWIQDQAPLKLQVPPGETGWSFQWQFLYPEHAFGPEPKAPAGIPQAVTARDIVQSTYLLPDGTWYLADPPANAPPHRMCHAFLRGDEMVTYTPRFDGRWERILWKGYEGQSPTVVDGEALEREKATFQGGHPRALTPLRP